MSRRAVVSVLVAAFAVGFGAYAGMRVYQTSRPASLLPDAAVAGLFAQRLPDAIGKTTDFGEWRGKTLVVNFWATWCPPCREEMPAFSRVAEKYAGQGVQFVGVALDSPEKVAAFAAQYPVRYPLLIAEAEGMALMRELGNTRAALPYTLIVAAGGEVLLTRLGQLSEDDLEKVLKKAGAP